MLFVCLRTSVGNLGRLWAVNYGLLVWLGYALRRIFFAASRLMAVAVVRAAAMMTVWLGCGGRSFDVSSPAVSWGGVGYPEATSGFM